MFLLSNMKKIVKRRLAKDRPLKVDQILQQRSAVPALKNKNAFKKPEMTDKLASKNEQKILKRKMENIDSVKPKKKKAAKKSYDLWGEGKRYIPIKVCRCTQVLL